MIKLTSYGDSTRSKRRERRNKYRWNDEDEI